MRGEDGEADNTLDRRERERERERERISKERRARPNFRVFTLVREGEERGERGRSTRRERGDRIVVCEREYQAREKGETQIFVPEREREREVYVCVVIRISLVLALNFCRFMVYMILSQTFPICKDAAGIAGNIFAFGLFVSPIPTFRRIIRNKTTEHFSGLPYLYALLNCLLSAWYGTPLVSSDNILVMTVNSIGAVFQFTYITLFLMHAEKAKQVRMFGFLLAVLGLFAAIIVGSMHISDFALRHILIGCLSSASLVSMFASPLFVINLVIRTKSVEFMPFYLSLSTFLMSAAFFIYGILNWDFFVFLPNGIGTILGIVQLALFVYYKKTSGEDAKEPLIVSYT